MRYSLPLAFVFFPLALSQTLDELPAVNQLAALVDELQAVESSIENAFQGESDDKQVQQAVNATVSTAYTFMDTERRHIFLWSSVALVISTYMGVMAFVNMPLKKDPLLYTKFYASGQ